MKTPTPVVTSQPSRNGSDPTLPDPHPAIALRNVAVRYVPGGPPVLDIEQLTIGHGERVALIGPSSSGKTSLLRLINGYVQAQAGELILLGERVRGNQARRRTLRRRIGFVFQDFSLVERATVFENVLWGRLGRVSPLTSLFGWFEESDKRAAMQAILEVDLGPQASQRADTLSGGQQQRVAVARVLAQEAEIILADEPVSNLDPTLADEILGLLSEVSQRHGATLLMSVHQPALAQRYADRVVGLRQGRVVYDSAADDLSEAAMQVIYGRDVNSHPVPNSLRGESRGRESLEVSA